MMPWVRILRSFGLFLLLICMTSIGACATTSGQGVEYQGARMHVLIAEGAIDISTHPPKRVTGWHFIPDTSARVNGLLYWEVRSMPGRIIIPFYYSGAISLVLAIPCLVPSVIARKRHGQLNATGFCIRCNYNLTGNTSGICPECGFTMRQLESSPL